MLKNIIALQIIVVSLFTVLLISKQYEYLWLMRRLLLLLSPVILAYLMSQLWVGSFQKNSISTKVFFVISLLCALCISFLTLMEYTPLNCIINICEMHSGNTVVVPSI